MVDRLLGQHIALLDMAILLTREGERLIEFGIRMSELVRYLLYIESYSAVIIVIKYLHLDQNRT